jgi:hypothetical protein
VVVVALVVTPLRGSHSGGIAQSPGQPVHSGNLLRCLFWRDSGHDVRCHYDGVG